jgi:hypothetical protein
MKKCNILAMYARFGKENVERLTEDLFKHDTDGDRNISYQEYTPPPPSPPPANASSPQVPRNCVDIRHAVCAHGGGVRRGSSARAGEEEAGQGRQVHCAAPQQPRQHNT